MLLSAGTRLGPYEIVALIGAGGMGEVYRARDSKLNREVAVKVLAGALAADADYLARFEREARVLASLNHPNIATVHGVEGRALVMELIPGPTLAERIAAGPVPLAEALEIARQIADALDAAHERGIVHRDLKPGNIKITGPASGCPGLVKVLDFGLAKMTEAADADVSNSPTLTIAGTRAGAIAGTAGYMSPEQARAETVDKRTDIWAFGVVLFEMLTGRPLFQAGTTTDTLAAVLTREPEWAVIPRQVERLLRQCLERDRKRRLRDIGDVWQLLESDIQKVQTSKSRWRWMAGAGVLAAIALAAVLYAVRLPRPAAAPLLRLNVDFGEDAALSARRGGAMALSPDNSRIVYVTGTQIVNARLALRRLDQPKAVVLAGTEGAEAPFFSPDGNFIGFFAGGKLKKVDVGGGAPIALCDIVSPRGGSWGDDGNIVFAPSNRTGLFRVPATGGTPQPVTEVDRNRGEDGHRYPQVLPGSKAVLFHNSLDYFGEGSVDVHSFQTGRRKVLVPSGAYPRYLPSGHLVYMHRGTLFAAPFDLDRLEMTRQPVPVLEDVAFMMGTGTAAYAFSQSGVFVYAVTNPEEQMRSIGMVDERGKFDPLPIPKARYARPRIAPDGSRLAVAVQEGASTNIWIYEWGSQRFSKLPIPAGDSDFPVWTSDGKYLVFASQGQTPGPGIYMMRADGAGSPLLLVGGQAIPKVVFGQPPRLIYETGKGSSTVTWMVPLAGNDSASRNAAAAERLFDGDTAAVSPDGRWIAHVGGTSGLPEVLVRPYARPGGQWQVSTGGLDPAWSRNGRELFYTGIPGFQIMVASYSISGDSFAPQKARVWSAMQGVDAFDLMPDGKRAVVLPGVGLKESTHATFLLNFMEDLRRRVPVGGR